MKIENNNLIARVAANLRYEAALEQFSPELNAETAQATISRAQQTLAVVMSRTDALTAHLDDAELWEVIDAALDQIALEHDVRASRAIKHKHTQKHMRAERLEKERRAEAARKARKEKRDHLYLI
jgi:hypothetical protein